MNLRDYQRRAIADLSAAYQRGARAVVTVLPTGAGKTVIAAEIIRRALERNGRVLFLVHREELLQQSVRKLEGVGITNIRIIRAGADLGRRDATVTVASIPTLTRWDADRLPTASLVIFDECHHTKANTWARLAAAYSSARLLGLTATPQRADGKSLGDIFDTLIVGSTVRELTELGHLTPSVVLAPPRNMDAGEIAANPVAAYRQHGEFGKFVVFCASVEHAERVATEFVNDGIACAAVHGNLSATVRAQRLAQLDDGFLRGVTCVHTLTEGWDSPSVSVCILLRKPEHAGTYLQMGGRVLRVHPGKAQALVIDLCGSSLEHGPLDAEREYTLDGKGIGKVECLDIKQCVQCGAVFMRAAECPACGYAAPAREIVEQSVANVELKPLKSAVDVLTKNLQRRAYSYGSDPAAREAWVMRASAAIARVR